MCVSGAQYSRQEGCPEGQGIFPTKFLHVLISLKKRYSQPKENTKG